MVVKKLYLIFNLIFVFLIMIMLYQAYGVYRIKRQVNFEIKATEQSVKEYTEKKNELENNIKNFSEEEKIERVARDRLNLKKEGEVTYRIVD